MRDPQPLTDKDWQELSDFPEVQEDFGIGFSMPIEGVDGPLQEIAYACKFDFSPQIMPGYRGDVLLLFGDSLEPMVFIRDDSGELCLVEF